MYLHSVVVYILNIKVIIFWLKCIIVHFYLYKSWYPIFDTRYSIYIQDYKYINTLHTSQYICIYICIYTHLILIILIPPPSLQYTHLYIEFYHRVSSNNMIILSSCWCGTTCTTRCKTKKFNIQVLEWYIVVSMWGKQYGIVINLYIYIYIYMIYV